MQVRWLVSKKKKKPQHELKMKGTHCGTFIPFVSATGELISTYFILSVKLDENGEADVPIDILPSSHALGRVWRPLTSSSMSQDTLMVRFSPKLSTTSSIPGS